MLKQEHIVAFEQEIKKIKNVDHGHLDVDDEGDILAIGIFSDGKRHPKDIKRDVEETFRSVFGFRVNHQKISIIERSIDRESSKLSRVRFITAYQAFKRNDVVEGVVQLEYQDNIITGKMEVHSFEMEIEYIIANAAAKAITNIVSNYSIRIDTVRKIPMGAVDVICVTLSVMNTETGAGGMYVGSSIYNKDLLGSVAKAVLDGLNRRMDTFA
ncbi:hypothetical protein L1765_02375 [Microaerobacter geothermalis]|uniref:hypothetical protein n=1 Tax=Microaerobacter geothermalis TaxID=674972 RepID=UPI001F3B4495|nr:hypothetical protein [Microaerobacter geothermalis]MCF6092842.1 hypothetical protein [Microaerobacter geothermalis]